MPRRPPGAVRARRQSARHSVPAPCTVPGVSARTHAAVARIEAVRPGTGAVAEALAAYRGFLRQPGRYLYVSEHDSRYSDPVEARNTLGAALIRLPPAARAELRSAIAPLDDEFLRRTLPDPAGDHGAAAWWRQRLHRR